MRTTPEHCTLLCVYCFADMNCTENMHIDNFKLALESTGLTTSSSNPLGAVLVTVPHSWRHIFMHYASQYSVISIMRIPYLINFYVRIPTPIFL